MICLFLCVQWNIQHDPSRSVQLLWNADAPLFSLFMWFKADRETKEGQDWRLDMTMKLESCTNGSPCWWGSEGSEGKHCERHEFSHLSTLLK